MKRKFLSIIACFSLALFIGCGESKIPEGMNQETYDIGVQALKIMDKYNDADITADEADSRLDSLYNKLDKLELKSDPDDGDVWSEEERNLDIKIDISSFQSNLHAYNDADTYSAADSLRDYLNLN